MGDRVQVAVKQPTKENDNARIYLYSHWGGADVFPLVQDVLRRKQRWDDSEYLTRMIFNAMTKGDEDSETGFGIGNSAHGDVEHLIMVLDCNTQTISFEQPGWEHNKRAKVPEPMRFSEFIELAPKSMNRW